MADQYLGEIRMFAGNFAPQGWAFCNGQLLSISENTVLFSLIGTTYGGDGQTTFAVPDLRGRVALHNGNGYALAQRGGAEEVTLVPNQMPAHTHMPQAFKTAGDTPAPEGKVWAGVGTNPFSSTVTGGVTMNAAAIQAVGGNQPHENMMPYQVISFIIALEGNYPTTD